MKNQSITALSKKHVFTRNNNGEFFQEKFYFRLSRDNYDTNLLNNRTFGESTFFPGGKFNMGSQYWVFQIQLTGNPTVSYNNIKKNLNPGDMLVIPPRTKYTYIAGEKTMTKYFMVSSCGKKAMKIIQISFLKYVTQCFPEMLKTLRYCSISSYTASGKLFHPLRSRETSGRN